MERTSIFMFPIELAAPCGLSRAETMNVLPHGERGDLATQRHDVLVALALCPLRRFRFLEREQG